MNVTWNGSAMMFARRLRDLSAALGSQVLLELELKLAASSSSAMMESGTLLDARAFGREIIRACLLSFGSSSKKSGCIAP